MKPPLQHYYLVTKTVYGDVQLAVHDLNYMGLAEMVLSIDAVGFYSSCVLLRVPHSAVRRVYKLLDLPMTNCPVDDLEGD